MPMGRPDCVRRKRPSGTLGPRHTKSTFFRTTRVGRSCNGTRVCSADQSRSRYLACTCQGKWGGHLHSLRILTPWLRLAVNEISSLRFCKGVLPLQPHSQGSSPLFHEIVSQGQYTSSLSHSQRSVQYSQASTEYVHIRRVHEWNWFHWTIECTF
jgi:hypothetical protein